MGGDLLLNRLNTMLQINIEFFVCKKCLTHGKPEFINQPVCLFFELFDINSTEELYQLSDIPLSLSTCEKI